MNRRRVLSLALAPFVSALRQNAMTFSAALGLAKPGDTVLVRAGDYEANQHVIVNCRCYGNRAAGIYIAPAARTRIWNNRVYW